MSSNNKAYRRMDPETRAMVNGYEAELMQAKMAYDEAKNRLHNARINRGSGRRLVSSKSGFGGKATYKPGMKIKDLEKLVEERAEIVRSVEEKRNQYLTEKGLI